MQREFGYGIKVLCNIQRDAYSWQGELQWFCERVKGRVLLSCILRVVMTAFVYLIWRERNSRLFTSYCCSDSSLFSYVVDVVSIRLRGKSINKLDPINCRLYHAWNIYD
ncbi:hypothetical protein V6N13_111570 [Hibiscus sabdariffa]